MTGLLIVEPSKELGQVLSEAFQRREHRVTLANTAQEAITKVDNSVPKLVILELLMPRHNGLEFIYEFRTYAEWIEVPIVIYSQISKEEFSAPDSLLADVGIVEHFYKPRSSLKKLVETVEEILERHEARV